MKEIQAYDYLRWLRVSLFTQEAGCVWAMQIKVMEADVYVNLNQQQHLMEMQITWE